MWIGVNSSANKAKITHARMRPMRELANALNSNGIGANKIEHIQTADLGLVRGPSSRLFASAHCHRPPHQITHNSQSQMNRKKGMRYKWLNLIEVLNLGYLEELDG